MEGPAGRPFAFEKRAWAEHRMPNLFKIGHKIGTAFLSRNVSWSRRVDAGCNRERGQPTDASSAAAIKSRARWARPLIRFETAVVFGRRIVASSSSSDREGKNEKDMRNSCASKKISARPRGVVEFRD